MADGTSQEAMSHLLLLKNGLVLQQLAARLIAIEPGGRLNTVADYARETKAGQGTVQKALRTLEQIGAIRVQPRGHLGAFLIESNIAELWRATGRSYVRGLCPLPDSPELEGFATGVVECFESVGLRLHLSFLPGSARRLDELLGGSVDFAACSLAAARTASSNDAKFEIVYRGSPGTYYAADSLRLLSKRPLPARRALRVGIDRSSYDHVLLTQAWLSTDRTSRRTELCDISYHLIPDLVMRGAIDIAVWHQTNRRLQGSLEEVELIRPESVIAEDTWKDVSSLALIARSDDLAVHAVFRRLVDADRVEAVESEVIRGVRIPRY